MKMKDMQEEQRNNYQTANVKPNNNQKAVLRSIVVILAVITIVSIAIGLFAWSKYTATQNGHASVDIAKWNFDLKLRQGKQGATATAGPIDLATTSYTHVADGKIAPGTSGEFEIIVNTQGTEVSLTYDTTISIANCPRNMVFYKKGPGESEFTQISAGGVDTYNRVLNFGKYVPVADAQNGNFVETIKWDWPYTGTVDNSATKYDEWDTQDQGKTVTMDILTVGTEVTGMPLSYSTVTYGTGSDVGTGITNGGTITLKLGDEATETTNVNVQSGTESVTFSSSDSTTVEVDQKGKLTAKKAGTAVITITGNESGSTMTINVKVKPKIELQVGDTILYTPSTVKTYNWDQTLATSDAAADAPKLELKSGEGQSYNIARWKVLEISADGSQVKMVPENPVGSLKLQGAQGYNNAVKLLNDACSTLYSDTGITARSITVEDIEKYYTGDLEAAKTDVYTKQVNKYTGNKQYPEIYASEHKSVINEEENNAGANEGLGLSEQTNFIERSAENNNVGKITTAASIQPYQTYYSIDLGLSTQESLLKKQYWVASRCVILNDSNCNFNVRRMLNNSLASFNWNFTSGDRVSGGYHGLFPVVSLNSDILETTGTTRTYQVVQ